MNYTFMLLRLIVMRSVEIQLLPLRHDYGTAVKRVRAIKCLIFHNVLAVMPSHILEFRLITNLFNSSIFLCTLHPVALQHSLPGQRQGSKRKRTEDYFYINVELGRDPESVRISCISPGNYLKRPERDIRSTFLLLG